MYYRFLVETLLHFRVLAASEGPLEQHQARPRIFHSELSPRMSSTLILDAIQFTTQDWAEPSPFRPSAQDDLFAPEGISLSDHGSAGLSPTSMQRWRHRQRRRRCRAASLPLTDPADADEYWVGVEQGMLLKPDRIASHPDPDPTAKPE